MPETPTGRDAELSNLVTNVRHFLWNDDYMELLAHKLDLQKVSALVDIGSGLGYLSGLFGLYMKPGSVVHGFDTDADAVRAAQERADANPWSVNFRFQCADAHELPLADGAADLAVCQHVLMHMPDPAAMLREMVRVVRPGGRVVAFEPNRRIESLVLNSASADDPVEERLKRVRFQLLYEVGRKALGRGNDSVGDRLPALFLEAGLSNIEVRISDKAAALVPPYDTEEKRARVGELLGWARSYESNREFVHECFLAGGGTEAEFAEFEGWAREEHQRVRQAIQAERFVDAGGLLNYIVIGTKA